MKKVVLSAIAAMVVSGVASADTLTLYSDPKTGQVFTTPGEGRVEMGDFISAKEVDMALRDTESKASAYQDNMDKYVSKDKKNWSNKTKIGGYMQFRNTEWLDGEGQDMSSAAGHQQFSKYWADDSTANDRNFFIRRARVIISGSAGDHLDFYIQPDFASTPALTSGSSSSNFGQLRDFYGDVNIDKEKVHRVRIGQSKVPYGFENLQSSSKRLTLDRNDAFNSAVKDERDIGAFYYYTPVAIQELFKEIDDLGLKGSGNYGMFALGAYNGQGANNTERNGNNHIVSRFTYPFKTESGQIFEFGVQGYKGDYANNPTKATLTSAFIDDERIGITAIMYQQPFGIQAEWNWGVTPGADSKASTPTISKHSLQGGYIQTMYRLTNVLKEGDVLTPFVKWQYFDGYQKAETNAPKNKANDWEIGAEWQAAKEFELTAVIHKMNRSDLGYDNGYNNFQGTALRIQAQINY
jgi:phosphate-selective porin